jgi:helix-turn-helix protein
MIKSKFNNSSIKNIVEDAKENDFEVKKSHVSGYSILVVEATNSIASFTYYEDKKSRDEDFETLEKLLQDDTTK